MKNNKRRVTTSDAEIDAAIAAADAYERYRPKATSARYDRKNDRLEIGMSTGIGITIPRSLLQGLEHASPADVARVQIEDFGSALRWESLDVDHYVPSLISGVFGSRAWMSRLGKAGGASRSSAKVAAARENGKKGGRPRKSTAA